MEHEHGHDMEKAMDTLEEKVKQELDIEEIGPNMSVREAGKLGGYMVKHLIERAEKKMGKGKEEKM